MNVLITELFGQKTSPSEEVYNLRLLRVKLRGAGPGEDVVRQPGHASPRVRGHVSQHQQPVRGDEGVEGDGAITVGITHLPEVESNCYRTASIKN